MIGYEVDDLQTPQRSSASTASARMAFGRRQRCNRMTRGRNEGGSRLAG
jgi:hypothetical protein